MTSVSFSNGASRWHDMHPKVAISTAHRLFNKPLSKPLSKRDTMTIRTLDIGIDLTKPIVYSTCTQAVKCALQPRGGYIPPSLFHKEELIDESERNELVGRMSEENLHPTVMGVVVDYLTRFAIELDGMTLVKQSKEEREKTLAEDFMPSCLEIPLRGVRDESREFEGYGREYSMETFHHYSEILRCAENGFVCNNQDRYKTGEDVWTKELYGEVLSDEVIKAMCQLTAFDTMFRSGKALDDSLNEIHGQDGATVYEHSSLVPNDVTISHIRSMVRIAHSFMVPNLDSIEVSKRQYYWKSVLPKAHITFPKGMPRGIRSADADFIAYNMLIDMKVSKKDGIDNKQTLQLIMYLIMSYATAFQLGRGFGIYDFGALEEIRKYTMLMTTCGILNPRQGTLHYASLYQMDKKAICAVIDEVMGGYDFVDTERFVDALFIEDCHAREDSLMKMGDEQYWEQEQCMKESVKAEATSEKS